MPHSKNVALVHDWLVTMRGGEKVLEVLCELFPDAPIFTLVHREGNLSQTIERMNIKTSFIQHLPFGRSHYQYYLPAFPAAVKRFDLREFDLVISSSSAVAKGVTVREDAVHMCYCHTPMRYIWDQYEEYFGEGRASTLTRAAMSMSLNYLRRWDVETARGVTHFIANSRNVQERIKRIYHRDSVVIFPPVDVGRFSVSRGDEGYYLIVSALVPYKRVDLAVEAFGSSGERLVIIGSGSEERRLKAMAGKNIEFLGWVDDRSLQKYYAGCRALIFPGEEDFGIVPVEAMACGKPVVAYGEGGALETVVDGKTGILFHERSAVSLLEAIEKSKKVSLDPESIREHVRQFERERCKQQLGKYIESVVEGM
ncbi:MAG: glycosyltransferase [Ignavibacteria bacterium]|nr:glycosyltransferase [Ignavibacteria bacterium]